MALMPCRECGVQVSTAARHCPQCGVDAPTRSKAGLRAEAVFETTATIIRALVVGGLILGLVLWISQPKTAEQQALEKAQEIARNKPVDYSKPIYTEDYAWVCPQSLLLDHLSASGGMRAYEDAMLSIFNRSEKFARLGCQQWRGGVRVYARKVDASDTDIRIVSIRLSPGDIATLFTSEHELKNIPEPLPILLTAPAGTAPESRGSGPVAIIPPGQYAPPPVRSNASCDAQWIKDKSAGQVPSGVLHGEFMLACMSGTKVGESQSKVQPPNNQVSVLAQNPTRKSEAKKNNDPALAALDHAAMTMANSNSGQLLRVLNGLVSPNARTGTDAEPFLEPLTTCEQSAVKRTRSAVSLLKNECNREYVDSFSLCTRSGETNEACVVMALWMARTAIEGYEKYCLGTSEDATRFGCR
jgi:hypothetical protein